MVKKECNNYKDILQLQATWHNQFKTEPPAVEISWWAIWRIVMLSKSWLKWVVLSKMSCHYQTPTTTFISNQITAYKRLTRQTLFAYHFFPVFLSVNFNLQGNFFTLSTPCHCVAANPTPVLHKVLLTAGRCDKIRVFRERRACTETCCLKVGQNAKLNTDDETMKGNSFSNGELWITSVTYRVVQQSKPTRFCHNFHHILLHHNSDNFSNIYYQNILYIIISDGISVT